MKRKAQAVWSGNIKDGNGHLTTGSTVLNKTQYSFNSRFENGLGTNPEELLAAAHAGCFTMKLSLDLTEAGYEVAELKTNSTITLEEGKIIRSVLDLEADIPGIDKGTFDKIAKNAEATCPVGKAFNFEIVLNKQLKN